jgi:hypothetical protein
MKRFIGVAALALAAQSGLATAQTVVIPSDDMPLGRAERGGSPQIAPGRPSGGSKRDAQDSRSDDPRAQPRGAQNAPSGDRSREGLREPPQQRQRVQSQDPRGERQGTQPSERPQREQAQRERPEAPDARRSPDEQRNSTRNSSPPSTQPQRRQDEPSTAGQRQRTDAPAQQGQAPAAGQPAPGQPRAPGQAGATADRPTAPAVPPPNTAGAPSAAGATTAQPADQQQNEPDRRRIAETVRERVQRNEIRPVQNLGVAVSVGAELPARVQLQTIPRDIATIRPEYSAYRYTVSDREIIIVDPGTRRIVDIIEREDRGASQTTYAVFEQRRDLRRWRRPDTVVFQEGVILPDDAPYYDLPPEIIERNPNWRGYRYVMTERDEVAIVEPASRRIVEVVDKAGSTRTAGTQSQPQAPGSRHQIVRIILNDARPGDIMGADGLRGAVLPSQMILRPVPAEAAEEDPQLRGQHYTLLGDDVLIVDPTSRRIVDVIE